MDVIGEWLSVARVSGTVFSRSELTEPWGFLYPAAPRIAFHIVAHGRAYLKVPGRLPPLHLGQGDVVLLVRGEQHELSSRPDEETIDIFSHLARYPLGRDRTLRWGGGGPAATLICGAYHQDSANSGPLISILPQVVHLPADEAMGASSVQTTIQLLAQELSLTDQSGDAVLTRLVDLLLLYVLRVWSTSRSERSQGWLTALGDPHLAIALTRVHEHPSKEWTVASLAVEAGMSRSAFAQHFANLVGEPPLAYVTRWRMMLAARLLADTTVPIASVATRVGYTSEFAFNRAFSRVRGIAPGQWRTQASRAEKTDRSVASAQV